MGGYNPGGFVPRSDALADPAVRVIDALGREWAAKTNGAWAALGHAVTVESFSELSARYGVAEVRP